MHTTDNTASFGHASQCNQGNFRRVVLIHILFHCCLQLKTGIVRFMLITALQMDCFIVYSSHFQRLTV